MKRLGVAATGAALLALSWQPAYAESPEVSLGGQYRVNMYTLKDKDGAGDLAAARVRIRQNIDLTFSEHFSTHVQLNYGHITEGIGNHTDNTTGTPPSGTVAGIRHAVMNYKFSDSASLIAGLVPLSDKFGDTLFSGDWDFNPVTLALAGDTGAMNYRAGWFKVAEAGEVDETTAAGKTLNDISGYTLDLGVPAGGGEVGAMVLAIQVPKATTDSYDSNTWFGLRYSGDFGGIKAGLSFVSSSTKSIGASASGTQIMATAAGDAGGLGWSVLALTTSGKTGGTGFISPQTLYGGQGYWGKTGILNIQGPTDTGMDANMLRTDNGGLGLTTVQVGLNMAMGENLGGYLGAGFYQAGKEAAAGAGTTIGTDIYAQAKYNFPDSPLAIEAGIDLASLGKAAPNAGGKTRSVTAVFSRLQAEF